MQVHSNLRADHALVLTSHSITSDEKRVDAFNLDDLVQAARLDEVIILDAILAHEGVNIDATDAKTWHRTALMHAVAWGATNAVQLLLRLDDSTTMTENMLEIHGLTGWVIVRRGADATMQDPEGVTALHLAAENGFERSIKMLLELGGAINVDAKDDDGYTPLHVAASEGFHKCVKELLLGGASMDLITTLHSKTALDLAMEERHHQVTFLLRGWDASWSEKIRKGKNEKSKEWPGMDVNIQLFKKPFIRQWSVEDVVVFLKQRKLMSYIAMFRERKVDGLRLLEMTEERLDNELGMTNNIHRLRLLRAIAELNLVHGHEMQLSEEVNESSDEMDRNQLFHSKKSKTFDPMKSERVDFENNNAEVSLKPNSRSLSSMDLVNARNRRNHHLADIK